jgi:hypothetical protein
MGDKWGADLAPYNNKFQGSLKFSINHGPLKPSQWLDLVKNLDQLALFEKVKTLFVHDSLTPDVKVTNGLCEVSGEAGPDNYYICKDDNKFLKKLSGQCPLKCEVTEFTTDITKTIVWFRCVTA